MADWNERAEQNRIRMEAESSFGDGPRAESAMASWADQALLKYVSRGVHPNLDAIRAENERRAARYRSNVGRMIEDVNRS